MFRARSPSRPRIGRSAWLAPLVAAAALAACSGDDVVDEDGDGIADGIVDPNNVTVVTPTRPTGYVAGELVDAVNDEPIAGVEVTLSAGGLADVEPLTTDPSGTFEFGPIPAGATFNLRFVAEGYASVLLSELIIDDTAGDFPTSNGALYVGPLRLLRTTGTFFVQVVSEEGAPVGGAQVTVETAARYLWDDAPRGRAAAGAQTDAGGLATVEGLPDVWTLPPSLEGAGAVTVSVAPVDVDGDGVVDWSGRTLSLSGRALREGGRRALVVLSRPVQTPLEVIASNVAGLLGPNAAPAVLETGEPVRLVMNKPIDRESVVVDLRDELGEATLVPTVVVGGFENVLEIGAATGLDAGREYNLSVRLQALDVTPLDVFERSSPFFVRDVRDRAITATGHFLDRNADALWGTGADEVRVELSTPLGRPRASPAFAVELWLDLDLDGTSTVGDSAGELPSGGRDYPAPLVLSADEPSPPNGAGRSGFTRFVGARRTNLSAPLSNPAGSVAFEVRFPPGRNGGRVVTTPSGREVPERLSGTLSLRSP